MSEVKNCLTCRFEPEWEGASYYNFMRAGECKVTLPQHFCSAVIWAHKDGRYFNASVPNGTEAFITNCPAHQPKEPAMRVIIQGADDVSVTAKAIYEQVVRQMEKNGCCSTKTR